jgi:hypothetical protein
MALRILLAAVLAAVLMFLWGFLFWGVMNIGASMMQPLPAAAELDLLAVLRNVQAPSGMYLYPMPPSEGDAEAQQLFASQHLEGPRLQLALVAEGGQPMPASQLALGWGHNFLIALLAGCLLALAGRGLPCFGTRLLAVLLVVLVAGLWGNGADWIWWFHSGTYCLGNAAYQLGGGLLMAVVLAALVKCPGTCGGAN